MEPSIKHIKEDLERFDEILKSTGDIEEHAKELKKDDEGLLNKKSMRIEEALNKLSPAISSIVSGNDKKYQEIMEGLKSGNEQIISNMRELLWSRELLFYLDVIEDNQMGKVAGKHGELLEWECEYCNNRFKAPREYVELSTGVRTTDEPRCPHCGSNKDVCLLDEERKFRNTNQDIIGLNEISLNKKIEKVATTNYYVLVNSKPISIQAGDNEQAIEQGKKMAMDGDGVVVIKHSFGKNGIGSKEIIWKSTGAVYPPELNKTQMEKIKKTNFLTGEEELIEVEPEIVSVMGDMGEEIPEGTNTVVSQECQQIDPEQSKDVVRDQLSACFHQCYPNALTYQNIYQCAECCGLTSTMDKYDLIGIMNSIAVEVGLPRIDFSAYFPSDEITESADIQGVSGAVEYNEGDLQGAVKDFMETFDNMAESLYEIDRVLEERLKLLTDNSSIVESSKDVIKDAVGNLRKSAMVLKYLLSDLKVYDIDRAGKITRGKLIYKIQMKSKDNIKIKRTVDVELPILQGKVQKPIEFSYKNEKYPLESWYINDIFDR